MLVLPTSEGKPVGAGVEVDVGMGRLRRPRWDNVEVNPDS